MPATRQTSPGSGAWRCEPRRRLPTMVGRHHGRGHPLSRGPAPVGPAPAEEMPGQAPISLTQAIAVPATTFSYVFRRARKTRYASSPTSPCPSPTIRPSRTCAWRSWRKSPAASDPNKGRTTSRPSAVFISDRQKPWLEHHSRAHGKSRNPDRSSPRRLIGPDLPGQLLLIAISASLDSISVFS